MSPWPMYTGTEEPHDGMSQLPGPPPWRAFDGGPALPPPSQQDDSASSDREHRANTYQATRESVELVNAALVLRRPLLITGPPGSGKSSLPYAVARELKLGPVLRWNISSRTTLQDGLYQYDPMTRLYAASKEAGRKRPEEASEGSSAADTIEDHLRLGPLGTALLPYEKPRVLLIDEIDKSDLDLPNDLLNVLEEGQYEIPELVRAARHTPKAQLMVSDSEDRADVDRGRVRCRAFPFIVLTSNGEREFPPAFLRRCVPLHLRRPEPDHLEAIVRAHLGELDEETKRMVATFLERSSTGELATDQLLNAIYLSRVPGLEADSREALAASLMTHLGPAVQFHDY
ncbi:MULTISPECIES: MoxR family ATPase [unclassified Streptomyces]|uniref:AAA family ATPase n=1 Tax=unclassified Streptomyces TaxID=2593676 RepID=UPI00093AD1DB|nr:MoxR family ATPase [Streptomyces sp. TSRI0281]OKI46106.1 AAA family ATPase [Streptomyces sp. TSRI0281]